MLIDSIDDFNDYIIEIESGLELAASKDLIIREIFVLWYVLVEGIYCENFSAQELTELLQKKVNLYEKEYLNDPDYLFLLGWCSNISFWFFGESFKEETGVLLLMKAHKLSPKNSLFKWAVANELKLNNNQIAILKDDLRLNFFIHYDFGRLITDYFLRIIR